MKKLLKVVVWVVVVLAVLLLCAELFLGKAIKGGVNTFGSKLLGVEMQVEDVDFSLLRGRVTLEKLHVGNPEGFDAESLLDLEKATVDLDMGTLFSDPMVVESIDVQGMDVTYEQNLTENNIGRLLDNLNAGKEEKEEEEEKEESDKPAKKVVIKKFDVTESHVKIALVGNGAPIKIPDMHLENIGEQSGGMTGVDVVSELIKDLVSAIGGAVVGVGELAVDGVKAVGDGAVAAAGAIGDGAVAAASAVSDGAVAAVGAVTGLFSSDDDETEAEAQSEEKSEDAEVAAEEAEAQAEEKAEEAEAAAEESEGGVMGAITGIFSSSSEEAEAAAE